jgi:hypothetical protein
MMNKKRLIIAGIVIFIAVQFFDFIEHGLILREAYQATMNIWRMDMNSVMWIMYVTALIFSFLFVYIFIKGYEGKGIVEGIRYGLLIGLLMTGINIFCQYVIYPIPFNLAIQWFIYDMIRFVIYGIIVSAIYKPVKK